MMESRTESRPAGKWIIHLLIGFALIAPPLLVRLGKSDLSFHMEVMTVTSSQFTWQSIKQARARAWLIPEWNGAPRIHKPPLAAWLNTLAWWNLDPQSPPSDLLVLRARRIAFVAALLTLAGTYFAGAALGGASLGWRAMLITGSTILFIKQARYASYDTFLMGFSAAAMACGIHALRGEGRWRSWLACGVFWCAATMMKGAISFLFVGVPLAAMALWSPPRSRGRAWTGLGLAFGLGFSAFVAWMIWVSGEMSGALSRVASEYRAERNDFQNPAYYLTLLPMIFPWTLPFSIGLMDAWRRRRESAAAAFALLWFVSVVVILSIPAAKQQRYIVPVLPAVGLLAAWAFSKEARGDEPWPRMLTWQPVILFAASILLVVFITGQDFAIVRGWIPDRELAGIAAPVALAVGAALILLSAKCGEAVRSRSGARAVSVTATWMIIASTLGYYGYTSGYQPRYPGRATAEEIRVALGARPARYLFPADSHRYLEEPDPRFLFYVRRSIPRIAPEELADYGRSAPDGFLIARDSAQLARIAESSGWRSVRRFYCNKQWRVLYTRTTQ